MSRYKYCCVPKCNNTSLSAPEKMFIMVPQKNPERKKWLDVIRRDLKMQPLSEKTVLYVCEDHFDLERDATNLGYVKMFRQQGKLVQLRLKLGTLPSKFECQRSRLVTEKTTGSNRQSLALKKRKIDKEEMLTDLLSLDDKDTPEYLSSACTEAMEISEEPIPSTARTHEIGIQVKPVVTDKAVRVCPKFFGLSSKKVQANIKQSTISTHTSPMKIFPASTTSSQRYRSEDEETEQEDDSTSSSDCNSLILSMASTTISSSSSLEQAERKAHEEMCLRVTLKNIEINSKLIVGIPQECYFLIKLLANTTTCHVRDILITLKKLRCNHQFSLIAIDFGMSEMNASRIFRNTLPLINKELRKLIYWPQRERIYLKLPIPFRKNYKKIISIIDCFEIQIERPSNPYLQALTWSQYYGCNTFKFLISCTPNGFVSFVSSGFGGRISDNEIVKASGYMNYLSEGDQIMADRGFKNLGPLFEQYKVVLVRPPSVPTNTQLDEASVHRGKEIASLRVHIERVIGRLREFKLLTPHSTIDNKLLPCLDLAVETVAGLINTYSIIL